MDLTVRDAGPADAAAVQAVTADAFAQVRRVYRPTPQAVARARAAGDVRLVAMADGQVVGTLRYTVEPDMLHLRGLGVRPRCHRQGVARAMIDFLAVRAPALGAGRLSLYTIRQTGNVPIFQRLGFTVISEQPAEGVESPTGVLLTDVYMERVVPPACQKRLS